MEEKQIEHVESEKKHWSQIKGIKGIEEIALRRVGHVLRMKNNRLSKRFHLVGNWYEPPVTL